MKLIVTFLFAIFFLPFIWAQSVVKGCVFDSITKKPIPDAAIYIDGTTKGTITRSSGCFDLEYNPDLKRPLVVSFLGYKKQLINDYTNTPQLTIYLKATPSELDEVIVTKKKKQLWSREHMLNAFKQFFIGTSELAKRCEILNEDDIILEYDEDALQIQARSKKPIKIVNKALKYELSYDLKDFYIQYRKLRFNYREKGNGNKKGKFTKPKFHLSPTFTYYSGTSFYTSTSASKSAQNKREKAYKGSLLHFLRAVRTNRIKEEGFRVFYEKAEVNPFNFISLYKVDDTNNLTVRFFKPLKVVYDNKIDSPSTIESKYTHFEVDAYGNHYPEDALIVTGVMGDLKIAGALPLDFKSLD